MSGSTIAISGIAVTARPGRLADARRAIEALPGLEVWGEDRERSVLVVTQELPSLDEHVASLRRVQRLDEVLVAELVCHASDDAPSRPSEPG